ncbi:hypothetical protein [Nocardiopsis ganjiahuensis]|uniref:hypothetical protein n=1 Tax=Nocardiopsis ganjiahuensis TaxID=239984 RepID=UPI000347B11B|nr:hypothetical protein [Nocardiopsis ganjiahuensis]
MSTDPLSTEQEKTPSAESGKPVPDPSGKVHSANSNSTTWWLTGGSVLLVGAVVASVVLFFGGGDGQVTPDPARVAELEASADARHVDQVESLIGHTRAAHDELVPVLDSLNEVLPADGSAPADDFPDGEEIDDWLGTVLAAGGHFEHAESGQTDFNVTHAGLSGSVDLLGSALSAYHAASQAEGDQQVALLDLSADLRDQAVKAWSVAATQLDVVSIDAGHGHIHLYLPSEPGSGALQPDEAEEGEGASGGALGHDDH